MLISIYMPTKNRLDSLRTAISSVLNQSYQEIELIVVDDASSDDTVAFMNELVTTEPRVKFISQSISQGACVARNLAINLSTGVFVTGLDDDDEFAPEHISSLLEYWYFLKKNNVAPVSCIYPGVFSRGVQGLRETQKYLFVDSENLFDGNHVGNQIFAPREHYFGAGLFDETMPAWQDLEFFYRVVKKYGRARIMPLPTYIFDEMPRPDRISTGKKDKVMLACQLMTAKHAPANASIRQKLLMQVFADHYGFDISISDVLKFMQEGFWWGGYKTIIKKFIKRKIDKSN